MQNNILEYLENTAARVPDKTAFADDCQSLTFSDVWNQSRSIGSFLADRGFYKKPVVIFMKRQPKTLAAFLGAVYAGCYYIPMDDEMPQYRMELILGMLDSGAVICDENTKPIMEQFSYGEGVFLYDEIAHFPINSPCLNSIRARQLDIDPIYIVFTSGSTGVPKGVIGCHRSVIDYIENLCKITRFDEDCIFGNQTPLYFDAYLKEAFPTLKYGATMYLIPKKLFMFPVKLVEYLNEHKINTICWVVSALTMISSFKTFDKLKPHFLKTICFASEVFPMRQFAIWKENLPEARFINLYGPTETTGICCYYEVDREFQMDETLPIGRPFPNKEIILLNEENQVPPLGQQGEICVRGTSLTLGYYRNPEKTAEAFVQNPLNELYPEIIYRTGDIGRWNERGELEFLSRKDFQIKHMGHRIELGEIEVIVNMHQDVRNACCLFDGDQKKIVLFYAGSVPKKDLTQYLKSKLPRYMIPNLVIQLEALPLTPNGKTDRKDLLSRYQNMAF